MFDLSGRKALITGASGGIGEAIARALSARGATVGLHGTRAEKLQALSEDLGADRSRLLVADLSDRDAVKALGARAEQELGGVDILVNNAGITRDGLFVRMSDADWDAVMEVNLTAVFRLTRELTHPMMRRRWGRIVNITSVVGVTGNPGQTNYCATKAGMIGFSKALAQEIATRNITVNCVAPGFIQSAMTGKLNDKQKESIMAAIPMRRMGTVEEVAAAVPAGGLPTPGEGALNMGRAGGKRSVWRAPLLLLSVVLAVGFVGSHARRLGLVPLPDALHQRLHRRPRCCPWGLAQSCGGGWEWRRRRIRSASIVRRC